MRHAVEWARGLAWIGLDEETRVPDLAPPAAPHEPAQLLLRRAAAPPASAAACGTGGDRRSPRGFPRPAAPSARISSSSRSASPPYRPSRSRSSRVSSEPNPGALERSPEDRLLAGIARPASRGEHSSRVELIQMCRSDGRRRGVRSGRLWTPGRSRAARRASRSEPGRSPLRRPRPRSSALSWCRAATACARASRRARVERTHPQLAFGARLHVELAEPDRHVAADDDRTTAGLDGDHHAGCVARRRDQAWAREAARARRRPGRSALRAPRPTRGMV